MVAALVVTHCFTTMVIIRLFNVIGFLNNYIFINIHYSPIPRVLRGEIYRRKSKLDFEQNLRRFSWKISWVIRSSMPACARSARTNGV
jgi:hypothetical protein